MNSIAKSKSPEIWSTSRTKQKMKLSSHSRKWTILTAVLTSRISTGWRNKPNKTNTNRPKSTVIVAKSQKKARIHTQLSISIQFTQMLLHCLKALMQVLKTLRHHHQVCQWQPSSWIKITHRAKLNYWLKNAGRSWETIILQRPMLIKPLHSR